MKRFKWPFVIVVFAILALLFLTVNFHIARSATEANTSSSRSVSYRSDVSTVIDTDRVFLHVENRVGLGSALAWELRRNLEETGGFDVVLLNNNPGPDDHPLLLVGIREKRSFWSPFFARATVRIAAKYSSYTTDISLDSEEAHHYDGDEEQGTIPLDMSMEVQLKNATYGLVTLPAHRRMLASEAADQIVQRLREGVDEAKEQARNAIPEE